MFPVWLPLRDDRWYQASERNGGNRDVGERAGNVCAGDLHPYQLACDGETCAAIELEGGCVLRQDLELQGSCASFPCLFDHRGDEEFAHAFAPKSGGDAEACAPGAAAS